MLDNACEEEILRSVVRGAQSTIIVSHRASVVRLADRIYRVSGGSVREIDKPSAILEVQSLEAARVRA